MPQQVLQEPDYPVTGTIEYQSGSQRLNRQLMVTNVRSELL